MREARLTVLVLPSSTRSAPWACRSLSRAGFRVVGANHEPGRLVGRSLYCLTPRRCRSPLDDPGAFVDDLRQLCARERVGAVLPLDEAATQLLTYHGGLLDGIAVCAPTVEQFDAVCDKVRLARTAAGVGIGSPSHTVVSGDTLEGEWPPLPCIVKPACTSTLTSHRIVYRTASVAYTAEERDALVREMVAATGSALVEERVLGRAWRVHFVRGRHGFRSRTIETLRSCPPDAGLSSIQRVTAPTPGLVDSAEALLAAIDYRGIGSVQFLQDGGRLLVHDINLRMPATAAIAIKSGLDLPRLAVAEAVEAAQLVPAEPVRRVTYVWLEGELRNASSAPGEGSRDAARLLGAALRRDHVLDPSDPLQLVSAVAAAARARSQRRREAAGAAHAAPPRAPAGSLP
ncbi:MAG TPA: ATP-grasp domain-containing protein [Gaiellaceae bacterium]|nr:ATP-grasp domain-containing protein [Gaiellaceae bacterium]